MNLFRRTQLSDQMKKTIQTTFAAALELANLAFYLPSWLWRRRRMERIRREVVKNRILALTYDDGPNSVVTPQLLDLLRSRRARATFFMLGCHAQQHPEIVDRIIREGHDIGCHSDHHLNAWKTLPWSAMADVEAGYEHLSAWIGPDGMFRPPYGKLTLPTYWTIRRRGASVWWWTIDSGDTFEVTPSSQQVAEELRQQGGGVVLMHDGSVTIRSHVRSDFTLEVTEALLDVADRESLKVVGLSELCK
jgi:peptidoglycan/xylan/chitin deacetylase (PgdA/CDA1 family)